jgi:PhnB protein
MASKASRPVPEGYNNVTPYIICKGASHAIDWYRKVFGAEQLTRMEGKDGIVSHAELLFGDSRVMIADEFPAWGARGPHTVGGTPVSLMLYVADCDATFKKAVDHGAHVERPLEDQFYGDRTGHIVDPFGHKWTIATHIEDLTPEEMQARMASQPEP